MKKADRTDLVGGTPQENAEITLEILNGKKCAQRDVVVLNAAVAIYAAKKAESIDLAIALAEAAIDSGAALHKLKQLIAETNKN